MRALRLFLLIASATTATGPCYALEASDTMAAWGSASPDEKTKLVTGLLKQDGRESSTSRVVKCLDAASGVPGHSGLSIGDVVKACEQDAGEPV
ncbi:MAG: hypothetical protein OTI36_09850 [Beijerinckiaceae bacterium]|nr:hypothetical protein [Beijerinckiaceae bacterium]